MVVQKRDLFFSKKQAREKMRVEVPADIFDRFFQADSASLAKIAINKLGIENFSPTSSAFNARYSAEDLHVLLLVKELLGTKYGGPLVYSALTAPPTDIDDIRFRQGITRELLENAQARQEFENQYKNLVSIVNAYQRLVGANAGQGSMQDSYYYPRGDEAARQFAAKIVLLHEYLRAVEAMQKASFESGLKYLSGYAKSLSESDTFREMAKFVRAFTGHLTVSANIRISFNELGGISSVNISPVSETERPASERFRTGLQKLTPFYTDALIDMTKGFVDQLLNDILLMASYLGELEFYRGALIFAQRLEQNGIPTKMPDFTNEAGVNIKALHNPLILLQDFNDGIRSMRSVPNDLHFDEQRKLYVISGPNDGGKSWFLTAVGLAILLAQSGYPIPAEQAVLHPFDNIFTHFIPKAVITKRAGRFRTELQQLRYIFENATPNSLILLDEPCGGTDPGQGVKQSLLVLKSLARLGADSLFATHMHPVADEVERGVYPTASNLQVEVVMDGKAELTHRVLPGKAGQSYGELVAHDVGVDEVSLDKLLSRRVSVSGSAGANADLVNLK